MVQNFGSLNMAKIVDVPDSGRSWAVAFAGFLINLLSSGLTRSTGHMYVALIDTFGASRFEANLPFSVRVIVKNLAGPVVGALGQRFGPRNVTFAGGVLSSVGLVLCAFAPSVIWITFLCGGVHGFGFSMASTLGLIMVTQWFVKHKATGTGIAFSGSCFGSLILPILIEIMLDNFGLFGCFILTGGLILNVAPAALLMKEPSWMHNIETEANAENVLKTSETEKSGNETLELSLPRYNKLDANIEFNHFANYFHSENNNPQNGSCLNAGHGINNPSFTNSTNDITDDSLIQADETQHVEEKVPTRETDMHQETSILKAIRTLSCDPMFYMISISIATFALVLDPTFVILVDFMMDKGFAPKISTYFIIAFSIGDLVGRLSFGWVTDRQFLSVKTFIMVMQMSHGVFYLLLPVFYNFYVLMSIVALFGVITGASLVMIPILVTKYLPSVQSLAIGCVAFVVGAANMMVPSLIGYFRDGYGSYDGMIYVLGGLAVLIGFVWNLEPLLLKLKIRLSERNEKKTVPM